MKDRFRERDYRQSHRETDYPLSMDLLFSRRYPHFAALTSLLVPGFGGVGQLLLGYYHRASILLLVEWLVVFPAGLLTGLFPYMLLGFHLLAALDAWLIAG